LKRFTTFFCFSRNRLPRPHSAARKTGFGLQKRRLNVSGTNLSDVIFPANPFPGHCDNGLFFSPYDINGGANDCPVLLHCPFVRRAFNVAKGVTFPAEPLPSETDNPTWSNSHSGARRFGSTCLPSCTSQAEKKQNYSVKDQILQ
jgi:hypothetical protein